MCVGHDRDPGIDGRTTNEPVRVSTRVCVKNHVLDGGSNPLTERDTLGGRTRQYTPMSPLYATDSTQQGRHAGYRCHVILPFHRCNVAIVVFS